MYLNKSHAFVIHRSFLYFQKVMGLRIGKLKIFSSFLKKMKKILTSIKRQDNVNLLDRLNGYPPDS